MSLTHGIVDQNIHADCSTENCTAQPIKKIVNWNGILGIFFTIMNSEDCPKKKKFNGRVIETRKKTTGGKAPRKHACAPKKQITKQQNH